MFGKKEFECESANNILEFEIQSRVVNSMIQILLVNKFHEYHLISFLNVVKYWNCPFFSIQHTMATLLLMWLPILFHVKSRS